MAVFLILTYAPNPMKNILPTLLFFFSVVSCFAKQEVVFKNISLQTKTYNEVSCLVVKFDALLKYSYNNLLQQGDSCDQYVVEIRFKNNSYIKTTTGYATYTDADGYAKNSTLLLLSNDVKLFDNLVVYIPLAALNLTEGLQSIKPVFSVANKWNNKVPVTGTAENFQVGVPQKMSLNISVKEIVVAETDFKNEFWDYFFIDTNTAKPEVCWSILLAAKKINGSPYAKNSYTYHDSEAKDDVLFTISKNDIFYINVYDFDMMSFSDIIGSMRVDMNDMEKYSGSDFSTKFGKVLKMDFVVTVR